ncbi:hypothetical protein GOP47_0002830 [Adiantum capillus-veneris]|uniref:Uncharacterized protein n=1 Tax=Adiantum capillus-veneris TaxID=13818 RepID=A0A9D4VBD0_ADICA|nr:hypothetical protein GOP47_0002830 [Adiantum capillus-veneris]
MLAMAPSFVIRNFVVSVLSTSKIGADQLLTCGCRLRIVERLNRSSIPRPSGLSIQGVSFKERSMATQGGVADIAITITPPLPPNIQQEQTSPSSSAHINSFVKSLDRKARSYFKTFERSLSFSTGESRDEDPSSMTIEFLKARLQAQRAEYKAEKQKAQQLAKKVLELEKRLYAEIERRRKAEHHGLILSPRYSTKLRSFHSYNERMELQKFREPSSGEEHSDCCSEISSSEDGIFLISPSSLRHQLEHQHMTNQHEGLLSKEINETSVMDKESIIINDDELRKKTYGGSRRELYVPERSEDFDNNDTWHTTDSMDPHPSKIANTVNNSSSEHEKPLDAEQSVLYNQPYVQTGTLYEMDFDTRSEKPHYINATKEPMFSCLTCQQTIPQNHLPADGMTHDNFSHLKGAHALDSPTPLEAGKTPDFGLTVKPGSLKDIGQNQVHGYTFVHSDTYKNVSSGEYVKAILPLDVIRTLEDYEISLLRLSFEKLPCPCKKGSPNSYNSLSPLQASRGARRHGYRMSLDGGMDRLQEMRHKDRQSSSR